MKVSTIKILVLVFYSLIFAINFSYGQGEAVGTGMAVGFHLTQQQNDFGLGLNITSPYIANKKMAFRIRGNQLWHQHVTAQNESTWSPFASMTFGFVVLAGEVGSRIRLYGEGGALLLFPSTEFSNESSNFGGYGLFGFELFFYEQGNYFIELGGIGSGAKADKIPTAPIYSNGFLITVGYRHQF